MKRIVFFIALLLIIGSCEKEKDVLKTTQQPVALQLQQNPSPEQLGELPPATVPLKSFLDVRLKEVEMDPASLTPASVSAKLKIGESLMEHKFGHVPALPPAGDILVMFDLTGSMGGELSNAKANAQNIMNEVKGLIPDTYFGLISHMDYPDYYFGCGYGSEAYPIPYGSYPIDYPYKLDKELTSSTIDVANAINALTLGNGADGPESYSRALYETVHDTIGWRSGSKKIVLAILDNIPHDCDVYNIIGGIGSTGPAPGRDGIAGTSDDNVLLDVIQEMADNNLTLIVLCSGGATACELWSALAAETGGTAFPINADGTIPDGSGIQQKVVELIQTEVAHIDELTLKVCDDAYADWLTSVVPSVYMDIDLMEGGFDAEYDLTLTVPDGTEDGFYSFDVCHVGDGVEYGRQHVEIEVYSTIEVAFDYHPESCPNPLNRETKGMIPMAILGTDAFDVTMVDPESVKVEGVLSPIRWAYEDVSTPYMPYMEKPVDAFACNTFGPDGLMDLTLKFDAQEVAALFAAYEKGDLVKITITGSLKDEFGGVDIIGEDVIVIKK